MTLRSLLLASALLASASLPASAAGDNVVLIDVSKVEVPATLPGLCPLSGRVHQVWQGKAFHAGQTISLRVPCSSGNSFMTPVDLPHGQSAHLVAVDVLRKSKQGLARLDDAGNLIWKPSGRTYGPWGVAAGYRVLDGALLPAVPDHLSP